MIYYPLLALYVFLLFVLVVVFYPVMLAGGFLTYRPAPVIAVSGWTPKPQGGWVTR